MKKTFFLSLLAGMLMCMPAMAQSNFSMKADKWAKTVNLKQDISRLSYEELHMLKALVYATHGRWYTEPEINRVLMNKAEDWYMPLCMKRATDFYEKRDINSDAEPDLYTVKLTSDEQAF
ncbi:MAG: hypothetical protein J6X27_08390, partial [Bacteroidaceae bacterium]|nr:hypothetical protein [Bacteroidaceae bacterium]